MLRCRLSARMRSRPCGSACFPFFPDPFALNTSYPPRSLSSMQTSPSVRLTACTLVSFRAGRSPLRPISFPRDRRLRADSRVSGALSTSTPRSLSRWREALLKPAGTRKSRSAAEKAASMGVHRLSPHLVCAKRRLGHRFYQKAFGATELMRLLALRQADARPRLDQWLLRHACRRNPGNREQSPATLKGTPVMMHSWWTTPTSVCAGLQPRAPNRSCPSRDMFWGDRYGVIQDPFGHRWSIATRNARFRQGTGGCGGSGDRCPAHKAQTHAGTRL